jgi:hypothetical protein
MRQRLRMQFLLLSSAHKNKGPKGPLFLYGQRTSLFVIGRHTKKQIAKGWKSLQIGEKNSVFLDIPCKID